jgi:peptidyl-prolyl cis-trans isomerase C
MQRRVLGLAMGVCLPLFFLSGCEKELGERELAKINNATLTLEDFREIAERQSIEGKMRLLTERARREFLENYVISREVLYQEAKRKGVDQKKEILAKVEDIKKAMVIDTFLEEVLRDKSGVQEGEIQDYYKENRQNFSEPQEVRVRHIVVGSEAVIKEVLARLSSGEDFPKLASLYNVDNTRGNGGQLGFIRRGQLDPRFTAFEEASFALRKKGDLSEVVRTPLGFHVIRLEESRGTTVKPLDPVREKIRFYLHTKKKQDAYLAYLREMKSKSKIAINEKLWAEEEKKEEKPGVEPAKVEQNEETMKEKKDKEKKK